MGHQSWRDRWNSGDPGVIYVLRYDTTTYKIGGTAASDGHGRLHHLNGLGRYGITSWEYFCEDPVENVAKAEQFILNRMRSWRHPRYSSREIFFAEQETLFVEELLRQHDAWKQYQDLLRQILGDQA